MFASTPSPLASSTQWQTRLVWLGWTAAATVLAAGFWLHKLDNANQRALARKNTSFPAIGAQAPAIMPGGPSGSVAPFPLANSASSSPKN